MNNTEKIKQAKKLVVPCEVYSRVVGYYSPISRWNKGKKQEFEERKTFDKNLSM